MDQDFQIMTDTEISRYVFKPTQDLPIMKEIVVQYLQFYKRVGEDASAVLKFSGGSGKAVISDNPNKTIIRPSGSVASENIISVLNAALIASCKKDIRARLDEKETDDYRRLFYEKSILKASKKLNRKKRRADKKAAKKNKQSEQVGELVWISVLADDNSDIIEQEAEEAARAAMYAEYEQIPKEEVEGAMAQMTPSKPIVIDEDLLTEENCKQDKYVFYDEKTLTELFKSKEFQSDERE